MNPKKIKKYPPIAVSIVAMILFMASAITAIVAEWQEPAQPPEPTVSLLYLSGGQEADETHQSVKTATPTQLEPQPTYQSMIYSLDFDGEEAEILLKIAMAEAEGEGVKGKALVILTVLNRVWSEQFPNSIEEVVFQENQFSPTVPGGRYWTTTPDAGCYEALELVMSGWDESQGALYFESTGKDGWHSQNLEFLFKFGGHRFYR